MWARISRNQKLLLGGTTAAATALYLYNQNNNNLFKTRKNSVYAEQAIIEKSTWHAPTREQELSKLKNKQESWVVVLPVQVLLWMLPQED
jgi:hypothetical protein